jgi:hypothetical protein
VFVLTNIIAATLTTLERAERKEKEEKCELKGRD